MSKGIDEKEAGSLTSSPGFWGSVIGGVVGLVDGFNYKKQANDIERAKWEALNRPSAPGDEPGKNKNLIWIVAAALVIIGLVVLSKRPKTV